MRTNPSQRNCSTFLWRATAAALLIASIALLSACQGVSAGGTVTTPAPGTLTANPTSLNFGSVTVGKTQSLSGSIANTGKSNVTVSNIAISASAFTLSGIAAPFTIKPGQTAAFTMKFTPMSAGSDTAKLTITSDASNSSLAIGLSGS